MGGGSSTKGGMAMHKIPFAPQSSAGGEDSKRNPERNPGKQQLKSVLALWKTVSSPWSRMELEATPIAQHNSHIPRTVTVLPQIPPCLRTLEVPRRACLACEPWGMAGALHPARGAMKGGVLSSWAAKCLTSGSTSHHSRGVSQSRAAQRRLNKTRGTPHVCTQTTARRNTQWRDLVYSSGISVGTEWR